MELATAGWLHRIPTRRMERRQKIVNEFTWIDIKLYRALRSAMDSNSNEKLCNVLSFYHAVNRALRNINEFYPTEDNDVDALRVGIFPYKQLRSLENCIVKIQFKLPNIGFADFDILHPDEFENLVKQNPFLYDFDVFVFVSALPHNFDGWHAEVRYFREVVNTLNRNKPLTSIYIIDIYGNGRLTRLLKLFRKFIPLTSINLQPDVFYRTNTKLIQAKWDKRMCSNQFDIFKEIVVLPFIKLNFFH